MQYEKIFDILEWYKLTSLTIGKNGYKKTRLLKPSFSKWCRRGDSNPHDVTINGFWEGCELF